MGKIVSAAGLSNYVPCTKPTFGREKCGVPRAQLAMFGLRIHVTIATAAAVLLTFLQLSLRFYFGNGDQGVDLPHAVGMSSRSDFSS